MNCLICEKDVTVVKYDIFSKIVYLTCRHMARVNDRPGFERTWSGLRDGMPITLDLTNSPLLPLGDLDSGHTWILDFACPTCGAYVWDIGSNDKLACGHTVIRDANGELRPKEPTPSPDIYNRKEQPESPDTNPVPPVGFDPVCPTCGKPALEIGSIQRAGDMTIIKLQCQHKAQRWPDSTLRAVV